VNSWFKPVAVILAIAWLFIVTFNYYIVHKPFTVENALAILNTLVNIFIVVLMYALAAAIGRRFTRAVEFASPLEALVFHIGIGLGAMALITFALGLAGLLHRILFWAIGIIGALLLRDDWLAEWRALRSLRLPIDSRFDRGLVAFIIAALAIAFLAALGPTLAWDAQKYHLVEAKVFIAQGRINPPPDIPSFNNPALMEMLYLDAMLLKDDGATASLHLGYVLLTIGALVALGQRLSSARLGWLASAILLAVPSYLLVASWPYNDASLAFYAMSALYAVIVAQEKNETAWLIIAGVCAGMALGMKYTALDIPVALMAILWLGRVPLKQWWALLIPCTLIAAPWFLRNWFFMGNPVYPFFFGGRYWDAFRDANYGLFGKGLAAQPWRILLVPWEATILGEEGKAIYEATIGPLLLVLVPLLVFVWRDRNAFPSTRTVMRDVCVFAALLYLFWVAGMILSRTLMQSRLFFPAFPALALLAALAFDRLGSLDVPKFSLSGFARLWLGLVLGLTLLAYLIGLITLNPFPYLAGIESREKFLETRLAPAGYWRTLESLGQFPGARILFLWEPRAYYAPASVHVHPDEILDEFARRRHLYRDAAGIAQSLRADGYDYLLLNRWGLQFELGNPLSGLSVNDVRLLAELLKHYARQVSGTFPFDYVVEVDGTVRIMGSDTEPYVIYALTVNP